MSAGGFLKAIYETDAGNKVNVKIQPETLDAVIGGVTNNSASGPLTAGFPSAKVGAGRRTIGINCRLVRIKFTAAKAGYKVDAPLTIPALTPAFYNACTTGATGTYLDTACEVIGRTGEDLR